MNTLIIGSGFGLYGYLPSLYSFSKKIYLNKKYKNTLYKRKELKSYLNKVTWYSSQSKIISQIDIIVIAKRPQDQFKEIKKLFIKKNKIKHLFLEKPIEVSPNKSINLINFLHKKKAKYSVGFLFKYLSWYKILEKNKKKPQIFEITWNIQNYYQHTNKWKSKRSSGGGIVRFYGIHFIKLLFDLNFTNLKKVIKTKKTFIIEAQDKYKNYLTIQLNYSKKRNFIFKVNNKIKVTSYNPFLKKINIKKIDPRYSFLKKYICDSLDKPKINYYNDLKFIKFWNKIEKYK